MGREVRRVPKDWEHPTDEKGDLIPLYGRSFEKDLNEWNEEFSQWVKGFTKSWDDTNPWEPRDEEEMTMSFEDYSGHKPQADEYMPDWPEEERTHYQMYEDTSEGTPISPVMETPEELARWLVDNHASACGDMEASYEAWLRICKGGWACSMVIENGSMQSGVEAFKDKGL